MLRIMILVSTLTLTPAHAAAPWLDRTKDPAERARLVLAAMTQDEKFTLIFGYFGATADWKGYTPPAAARAASAGYVPGLPRLGIPPLWETDAGIGVASQARTEGIRARTALPSGLATAATWNPEIGFIGGAMIGAEARASGFNVMLAGGINLARDPRNGRNFEYAGEDPWLAGIMVGAQIRGIQSNHVISTVKHFALNDQETGRTILSSEIGEAAARESDLLAFQIAIEQGDPGAVMCAYNRVNSVYACENDWLLTQVLKQDWGYPYYVMSDWGAVHSAGAARAGLDQESAGAAFDDAPFFTGMLRADLAAGRISQARIDDMCARILRAMFAKGLVDYPVTGAAIDEDADAGLSQRDEEEAAVLLRNQARLLPLQDGAQKIAVIGLHADKGMLSGGGSSQVYPAGGSAVPGLGPAQFPGPTVYDPSPPLAALAALLPHATLIYDDGQNPARAAALAAHSDLAIVFAGVWSAEQQDSPLALPDHQDALIDAVAHANRRTVVVLETGGPVLMPWLLQTGAVLEAWYPGSAGGRAIARVLTGAVDVSGRLPISFPASAAQLPRPVLDGGPAPQKPFSVVYQEGAAVGYKWYDKQGLTPAFSFGFGLSYGHAAYSGLHAEPQGHTIAISYDVRNDSGATTRDVSQIYIGREGAGWEAPKRLGGWRKLLLAPKQGTRVDLTVDRRLLSVWQDGTFVILPGVYDVMLGRSSGDIVETVRVTLQRQ